MKSIFYGVKRTKKYLDSLEGNATELQKKLLKELQAFINSGTYTDYKKKDLFLIYEDLPDDALALRLGLSTETSVRKLRSRLSDDAYKYVGSDIFDLIESSDVNKNSEAAMRLRIAGNRFQTSKFFPSELIGLIKKANLDDSAVKFELDDCIPELSLLRWLSLSKMSSVMSNVDMTRLNYILNVLDSTDGTLSQRLKFVDFLCSSDAVIAKKYGESELKFPPKRKGIDVTESSAKSVVDNSGLDMTDELLSDEDLESAAIK